MKSERGELTAQMMLSWMQGVGTEGRGCCQQLRGQPLEVGFQILCRVSYTNS